MNEKEGRADNSAAKPVSKGANPDLEILAGSISYIPPRLWRDRMLFSRVQDKELLGFTGSFPATIRKSATTHPLFVLQTHLTGHLVCPCSTKGRRFGQRHIRKGCELEMSSIITDRDSFLVESCSFTMPLDHRLSGRPGFLGVVPECCISGKN